MHFPNKPQNTKYLEETPQLYFIRKLLVVHSLLHLQKFGVSIYQLLKFVNIQTPNALEHTWSSQKKPCCNHDFIENTTLNLSLSYFISRGCENSYLTGLKGLNWFWESDPFCPIWTLNKARINDQIVVDGFIVSI